MIGHVQMTIRRVEDISSGATCGVSFVGFTCASNLGDFVDSSVETILDPILGPASFRRRPRQDTKLKSGIGLRRSGPKAAACTSWK